MGMISPHALKSSGGPAIRSMYGIKRDSKIEAYLTEVVSYIFRVVMYLVECVISKSNYLNSFEYIFQDFFGIEKWVNMK